MLLKMRKYYYAAEKLAIAKKLGYETISEAIVGEYRKLKSARKVGRLFGMESNSIRFALIDLGEKRNGRGGNHR